MCIAARTTNLGAFHEERVVSPSGDIPGRDRLPKARPSSARIEFGCRAKQRRPAADTSVNPVRAQSVVLVGERRLCTTLTRHVVLLGGELLFPFGVALDDFDECSDATPSRTPESVNFAILTLPIASALAGCVSLSKKNAFAANAKPILSQTAA
jgi:hypothetical protein